MKTSPIFTWEREEGRTVLLPRPEALAASQARSTEVARAFVRAGYRVRGAGKNWRIEQDPSVCKLTRTL